MHYRLHWRQTMTTQDIHEVARKAEEIYATQLRSILEPRHVDEFVAIEPESGDYFLGKTLSDAIGAARRSHPDRLAHAMRVGHRAAIHFGMQMR
jgi:hypothetical protein